MTLTDESLPQRVRLFLFEHFLEHATPPVVEELMREFSLSRDRAIGVLGELEAARHIALVKGTERISWHFRSRPSPLRSW